MAMFIDLKRYRKDFGEYPGHAMAIQQRMLDLKAEIYKPEEKLERRNLEKMYDTLLKRGTEDELVHKYGAPTKLAKMDAYLEKSKELNLLIPIKKVALKKPLEMKRSKEMLDQELVPYCQPFNRWSR